MSGLANIPEPDWRERYFRLRALVEDLWAEGYIPKAQLAAYLGRQDEIKGALVAQHLGSILQGMLQGGAVQVLEEDKAGALRMVTAISAVRQHEALRTLDEEVGLAPTQEVIERVGANDG